MGCPPTYNTYSSCGKCEGNSTDFTCLTYTGSALPCSGINTNDDGETILQKIEQVLCSTSGDYSTYSMNCLPDYWNNPILDEATFVNAITSYACFINQSLQSYITSNNTSISNLTSIVTGVTNPNITCATAGVTSADDLPTVLNKYCTKFSAIDSALDISGITWNGCFTVPVAPSTIKEAFQLLSNQICSVEGINAALPTFNNIASCLPAPLTANDTLVDTINKIKTRLCQSPTYLSTNITWGCVPTPSSTTSIEIGLQQIVTKIGQLSQTAPSFNPSDFNIVATDPGNPCSGITVSLATPINQDRLVAATVGDNSPGVLQAKLTAGTNISLDYITTPGQVIINSVGGSSNYEVKGNTVDDDPGFLDEKLGGGGSAGVSVTPSYNPSTKRVDLIVNVNASSLFDVILDELDSNPTLYSKFCAKVRNCPSPCDAPTNVQAVSIGTTTTTTTTEAP